MGAAAVEPAERLWSLSAMGWPRARQQRPQKPAWERSSAASDAPGLGVATLLPSGSCLASVRGWAIASAAKPAPTLGETWSGAVAVETRSPVEDADFSAAAARSAHGRRSLPGRLAPGSIAAWTACAAGGALGGTSVRMTANWLQSSSATPTDPSCTTTSMRAPSPSTARADRAARASSMVATRDGTRTASRGEAWYQHARGSVRRRRCRAA